MLPLAPDTVEMQAVKVMECKPRKSQWHSQHKIRAYQLPEEAVAVISVVFINQWQRFIHGGLDLVSRARWVQIGIGDPSHLLKFF